MPTWLISIIAAGGVTAIVALLSRAKTEQLGYNLIGKPLGWFMTVFDIPYVSGKAEYKLKSAIVQSVEDIMRGALRRIDEVQAKMANK